MGVSLMLLDEIAEEVSAWSPRRTWLEKLPETLKKDCLAAKESYRLGEFPAGSRVVAVAIANALRRRGHEVPPDSIKRWLLKK